MPRPTRLLPMALIATACVGGRPPPRAVVVPAPDVPERRVSGAAVAQYVRARLADAAGDRDRALQALRLALVHDPDSPQLRIAYAEALARGGEVDRAEGEARRAVELATDGAAAVDARVVLGKVLATRGVPEGAAELAAAAELEAKRRRSPQDDELDDEDALDPEPWRALARVRLEAGDEEGAAAACEALAPLDPGEAGSCLRELGTKHLQSRELDLAELRLRRAAQLAPSEGEGWKLLAELAEARERRPEARADWERAIAADPDDLDALLAAGQLALRDGDVSTAKAWLGQLLESARDDGEARVRVAAVWLQARHPAEAHQVASGQDEPRLLYLDGLALQQLQRWRDAAAAFAAVRPTAGELYRNARAALAEALARAGRTREAVRAVRRGLQEHPGDPDLMYTLGEAYDRAGRHDAALEQMRRVLAVKADHADALNFLGYAYAERGERLGDAQRMLERAVELEPGNGYYLDSLGWLYYKRGDLDRAVKTLERADALAGPEPTILEHLGDSYRAALRPADAAAAYRRALQAPEPPQGDPTASAARASVERKLRELRG